MTGSNLTVLASATRFGMPALYWTRSRSIAPLPATSTNSKNGILDPPQIGEFKNGRGEFYDQEDLNGRAILVRFVISEITANSCHFEQAFSDDGGKTWELNWITTDTRVKSEAE